MHGNHRRRYALAAVTGALALAVLGRLFFGDPDAWAADLDRRVPAAAVDEVPGAATSGTLILAGGCFWGVQGVFQHVRGVTSAVSGYDGGTAVTAQYEIVSTGVTGHAESVRITYDPHVVTYGRLLQIFFSVTTDPTQRNRQYPDEGTQYRSEIFATTPEQARIAKAYIAQLDKAEVFPQAIVTKVAQDTGFYPAEGYHQNYLTLHPGNPYIATFDLPKIMALQKVFPADFRSDPVLVPNS
ncbi:MAG TPA: peptide-methionine (S)-S-oxide reductase MsrA [Rhodopila sp.]|uniref:peptide-methionine (S)-S-oxide reductase MsrA n=1 Tax=Rhodopila sp. TaxID=2480087 RepID=UPI002C68422D|nr:peptide-methionine (S)-S-oxide reductase MsrA [Rhodopila sp.]HVY17197.1 peptide-methionine (S)-S-oxide reductase MsrA [Rhodopila sp.]